MESKELRIGNYVASKSGKIYQVCAIRNNTAAITNENKLTTGFYKELEPIPLTAKILERLGFNTEYIKGYIGIDVSDYSDFVLTEPMVMGEWQKHYCFQFTGGGVPKFKELKHVHQLQNLFFALTGEELKFKDL